MLGGIGLSMPLMMSERDILTTPSVSQSLEQVLVDNCSKRHSFPLTLLLSIYDLFFVRRLQICTTVTKKSVILTAKLVGLPVG